MDGGLTTCSAPIRTSASCEPLQGKFFKVTEPGAFASFVGKLDPGSSRTARSGSRPTRCSTSTPSGIPKSGDEEDGRGGAPGYCPEIGKVIGRTRTPLLRYYVMDTPMDNLITDALMWKFDSEFVVSNGFASVRLSCRPPAAKPI